MHRVGASGGGGGNAPSFLLQKSKMWEQFTDSRQNALPFPPPGFFFFWCCYCRIQQAIRQQQTPEVFLFVPHVILSVGRSAARPPPPGGCLARSPSSSAQGSLTDPGLPSPCLQLPTTVVTTQSPCNRNGRTPFPGSLPLSLLALVVPLETALRWKAPLGWNGPLFL